MNIKSLNAAKIIPLKSSAIIPLKTEKELLDFKFQRKAG
jgi:hypothetical protein